MQTACWNPSSLAINGNVASSVVTAIGVSLPASNSNHIVPTGQAILSYFQSGATLNNAYISNTQVLTMSGPIDAASTGGTLLVGPTFAASIEVGNTGYTAGTQFVVYCNRIAFPNNPVAALRFSVFQTLDVDFGDSKNLTWDVTDFVVPDTFYDASSGTGKFTAPVTGYYRVDMSIMVTNLTEGLRTVEVDIFSDNGSVYFYNTRMLYSNMGLGSTALAPQRQMVSGSILLFVNQGDNFWFQVSSSANVHLADNFSNYICVQQTP